MDNLEIKRTVYDCTLPFESEPFYVVIYEVVQREFNLNEQQIK